MRPSTPVDPLPAEEDVAGRLHEPLALDDTLAVVGEAALAQVRLEHRGLGFLHLQEQRVVVVEADQERHPAAGADAADADHLPGQLHVPVALEQVATVGLQGVPVRARRAGSGPRSGGGPTSPKSSSTGTNSGGSLRNRGSPSTSSVSLDSAFSRSFDSALLTVCWKLLKAFLAESWPQRA